MLKKPTENKQINTQTNKKPKKQKQKKKQQPKSKIKNKQKSLQNNYVDFYIHVMSRNDLRCELSSVNFGRRTQLVFCRWGLTMSLVGQNFRVTVVYTLSYKLGFSRSMLRARVCVNWYVDNSRDVGRGGGAELTKERRGEGELTEWKPGKKKRKKKDERRVDWMA